MRKLIITASLLVLASWNNPKSRHFVNYYILAGQSNLGRSQFSLNAENDRGATPEQIKKYGSELAGFKIYNYRYDSTAFHEIRAGRNTMLYNPMSSKEFGAEVSLFTSFKDAGFTGDMYLTKFGFGNTDLATMWIPGGECNILLKKQIARSIELIKRDGGIPVLRAFIWMQGENDAINSNYAREYYGNLTRMFNDFKEWYKPNEVPVVPYKIIIGRIAAINDPTGVVRKAQEQYCLKNNATLLDTDHYGMHEIHYNATGQIQFGNDLYNLLK